MVVFTRLRSLESAKRMKNSHVPMEKRCFKAASSHLQQRASKYFELECELSGSASEDESIGEETALSGSFINDGSYTQLDSSQEEFMHRKVDCELLNASSENLFDIRFGNKRIHLPHLQRAIGSSDQDVTSSNTSISGSQWVSRESFN